MNRTKLVFPANPTGFSAINRSGIYAASTDTSGNVGLRFVLIIIHTDLALYIIHHARPPISPARTTFVPVLSYKLPSNAAAQKQTV